MKINEVFKKKLRNAKDGVNVVGGIDAVVSANVNEPGTHTHVSTKQRRRIVQRGGRTVVDENITERTTGGGE